VPPQKLEAERVGAGRASCSTRCPLGGIATLLCGPEAFYSTPPREFTANRPLMLHGRGQGYRPHGPWPPGLDRGHAREGWADSNRLVELVERYAYTASIDRCPPGDGQIPQAAAIRSGNEGDPGL